MRSPDRKLSRLSRTPEGLPELRLDLEKVARRSRVHRVRRASGVAALALVLGAGVLVPLWALSGLAPSRFRAGGEPDSRRLIRVPDHGFLKSKPYHGEPMIDREEQDRWLVTEKMVIGMGRIDWHARVDGRRNVPWTMVAYLTRDPSLRMPGGPPVPCSELQSLAGSTGTCPGAVQAIRDEVPVPPDPDRKLYLSGPSYHHDDDELPEIVIFSGAISKDVVSVEVRTSDGRTGQALIMEAPPEIGWKFFVVFPPPFVDITVIAQDASGDVVERRFAHGSCLGFVNADFPDGCKVTRATDL